MPPSPSDVAYEMATAWNRICKNTELADELDVWPCCQILAAAGVVIGQEEALAAIEIGPFRIAVAPSEHATRDFIEVLFPAAVASLPTGQPLMGAVSGALSAACLTFLKLLERSITFGRSNVDVQRWTVLMHIKNCNTNGICPTTCDAIDAVAYLTEWDIRPNAAEAAIEWLLGPSDEAGRRSASIALVRRNMPAGGLEALV